MTEKIYKNEFLFKKSLRSLLKNFIILLNLNLVNDSKNNDNS